MAESAVKFLINHLGPLLAEELKLQKGVRGEVLKIRDELESMRAFLRDADAKENHSESVKEWVKQVSLYQVHMKNDLILRAIEHKLHHLLQRHSKFHSLTSTFLKVKNAACDIEDILDEFILHTGGYQVQDDDDDDGGACGFLRRMVEYIKQLMARHQIGKQIQDMRVQLSEISKRKEDYNFHRTKQVLSLDSNSENQVYDARLAALFIEESQLVGIDGPKAWVIDWLLSEDQQRLSTMSVVGMGGLGKTTLIKKVYDCQQVKEHFETYAWITVSETFKKMELLQDMIKQFYQTKQEQVPFELGAMTDMQLIQVLREYLHNKRFVLVADDVWEVSAWNVLSLALPVQENGSRVVLTMRKRDVASSCCIGPSDYIYELQPLNPDAARSLFCKRAFRVIDERNLTLSPELEKLTQSFVNKCRGLPLAIVTLGGLLATKDQTFAMWDIMHRSLGSELDSDNQLKSMMEILWLSFNDLPYYLKSCFLCLSIFPEDFEIMRGQILYLWIAEGFIEKKEGMTLVEIADSYFYALLSRSLIQVTESEIDGEVISFRVHDLLREIIISKSGEENLIIFSSNIEEKITLSDRVRRLSIYHNKGEMVPKCECSSHVRSFFVFGEFGQSVTSSAITSFDGLHLLRVLSISNIYMDSFPKDLTKLLHFRYLNLYGLEVKHLPRSIGNLRNLESLVIEDTFICELPMEICRLQRLCRLSVSRKLKENGDAFHFMDGVKAGNGIGSLRSLQELRRLEAESGVIGELGKLTELRMLEIIKLKREDGHNLCSSIEKMKRLHYLQVSSKEEDEEIDLHSLLNSPITLQELGLYGSLKKLPHWISTLKDLRTLRLGWSGLKDDPLKALSSLPNLVVLNIINNAYDGEELYAKEGAYSKLRELSLIFLSELKNVKLEKGTMPKLEVLKIDNCEMLMEAPSWLEHLTNLKKLELTDMPISFLNSLQNDSGEQRADFIGHIALISHYDSASKATQKF